MKSRILFGAFALAATLVAAGCASSTAPATTTKPPTSLPTMPMDTMPGTGSAASTTDPMTMGTDPMAGMDMGGSDSGTQGLTLQVASAGRVAGQPNTLAFKVIASDGSTLTRFQVEQTKLLHLILVRSDLTGFQHLHPTMTSDGRWSVPVTFPNGGTYRMVADFVPVLGGTATTRVALSTDLVVAGTGTDVALPAPSTKATVDGYTVQISGSLGTTAESALTFTVVDSAGKPVKLEPYLGAFGHLVAFDSSDLAYTHIHPSSADQNNGSLTFTGQVAAAGLHRLFMQFSAAGIVHVAEFTVAAK